MTENAILARKLRVMAAVQPEAIVLHLDRHYALSLVATLEREARVVEAAAQLAELAAIRDASRQLADQRAERHGMHVLSYVIHAWLMTINLQWWLS